VVVVDASVVVTACLSDSGFAPLQTHDLVAPPILWSEALSALHEMGWRRAISRELAEAARDRLLVAPVTMRRPKRLLGEAWWVAERLGLAKTYDAEYIALGRLLRCPLVTLDGRLHRRAAGMVEVVGPVDLAR
jgi:predicted nucleic acid-binding protein